MKLKFILFSPWLLKSPVKQQLQLRVLSLGAQAFEVQVFAVQGPEPALQTLFLRPKA